jgi:hypothetical protein
MAVPLRLTWLLLLALGAAALLAGVALTAGTRTSSDPAIIISISAMMAAFGRNIAAMNALRATRDQMATMAVERERSRVARDLHDILGHSLTVITVKTELAGRLIDVDPERARAEIGEVEQLARGALPTCAPPSPATAESASPASSPRHGRRSMPRASQASCPARPTCPPTPRTGGLDRARGRHQRDPPRAGVALSHAS